MTEPLVSIRIRGFRSAHDVELASRSWTTSGDRAQSQGCGRKPIASEVTVNDAIARVAGPERTVELARDFEAVAKLHGHRHKPERAAHWFALARSADDVPEPLASIVERTVALARQRTRTR